MNERIRRMMPLSATAALLLAAGPVAGDGLVPMQDHGNHGALVIFDQGCGQGWVDVSGNSTPFFPNGNGLIIVLLDESVDTITPSARINTICKGRLPLGEQVEALDLVTGQWILATLATRDELCESVAPVWPRACRGNNGPYISTYETVGVECSFTDDAGQLYSTRDWISVTTTTGQSMLSCHFDFEP
jgi:hypothetical protein